MSKLITYIKERVDKMEELNIEFNNYINEFKNLDSESKMKEIIDSVKELISFFDFLATSENVNLQYLRSRELLDLKREDVTQDDYLEAILVYVEVAKNLIAQYLDSSLIEDNNN